MFLIASESLERTDAIHEVVREMSLALVRFGSSAELERRLAKPVPSILLLAEDDLDDQLVACLKRKKGKQRLGVIIAGDSRRLRDQEKSGIVDFFVDLPNAEWIGLAFTTERLAVSANRCRRRMLRVSRDELEDAFDNFEYLVQYQPKVERTSDRSWLTREAEALVRWRHPERGLLPPLEFLPEIEAFGMMGRLTEVVLRKAAAQLCNWDERGLFLRACVNLASSQLGNPELGDHFADIVREFGIEPDRFTFELVERDLADREAPQVQCLENLRKAGFRLCLDNFRVAAATLGVLEDVPFDEIKVHGSTLAHAQENPVAEKVLAALIGLAHNLDMTVTAEGVEDEETFQFLKTIGCDKMQGFLVSEAVLPHIIRRVYSAKREDAA